MPLTPEVTWESLPISDEDLPEEQLGHVYKFWLNHNTQLEAAPGVSSWVVNPVQSGSLVRDVKALPGLTLLFNSSLC